MSKEELDLELLQLINPVFNWLVRQKNGTLWVYMDKPEKGEWSWGYGGRNEISETIDNDLIFTDVQWEDDEPTYIPHYIQSLIAYVKGANK